MAITKKVLAARAAKAAAERRERWEEIKRLRVQPRQVWVRGTIRKRKVAPHRTITRQQAKDSTRRKRAKADSLAMKSYAGAHRG